jgi:uncharacterized protein
LASPDNPQFEPHAPLSAETPSPVSASSDSPLHLADQISPITPPARSTENPAWNGWDVLAILGLALVTLFVIQVAILFAAHYLFYPRIKLMDLAQRSMLVLISSCLFDGAMVMYLLLLVEGKYHQPFWPSIRWNWPRQVWGMLTLGGATYLILAMLGSFLPMPKDTPFDKLFENPRDAYLLAIMATTLGPLMEELFFRGFLYPVIARRWGAAWGVFLAALPFALLHMQQYGYSWGILVLIFGVGLVCGIVRAITGSVASSFLVHAAYNGAQMLIAVSLTHGFTRMPKGFMGCWPS